MTRSSRTIRTSSRKTLRRASDSRRDRRTTRSCARRSAVPHRRPAPPSAGPLADRSWTCVGACLRLRVDTASDEVIWQHAVKTTAVLITKDQDFASRRAFAQGPPAVVWIRVGNTRRPDLLARINAALPDILAPLG